MDLHVSSEAPDGGWGWMIVLAAFLQSALFFGVIRSFGVFFVEFVDHFEESASATSWISSVTVAVSMFTSPLASALGTQYGERPVAILGGCLSGAGLLFSSFATSLVQLYVFIGLFTGIGGTLAFSPTVALLGRYFRCRRGLANSLALSGASVSALVLPPLFQFLVDSYGWRGALLVLAGMVFNLLTSAVLLRPLPLARKEAPERDGLCSRLAFLFQFPLLYQRAFVMFGVAQMLTTCGYIIPFIHLVPHARVIGFEEYQAALLISVVSMADLVGRIAAGWLADHSPLRFTHNLALWTILAGMSVFLIPLGRSYGVMVVLSISYGFLASAIMPLKFSSLMELVGAEQMMGAVGLLSCLESPGALGGPPLAEQKQAKRKKIHLWQLYLGPGWRWLNYGLQNGREREERKEKHSAGRNWKSSGGLPNLTLKRQDLSHGMQSPEVCEERGTAPLVQICKGSNTVSHINLPMSWDLQGRPPLLHHLCQ